MILPIIKPYKITMRYNMKVITNPDEEFVKEIKAQIKANNGYCPSSFTKNRDTKCMCKDFKESKSGMCRCGLYIKEED